MDQQTDFKVWKQAPCLHKKNHSYQTHLAKYHLLSYDVLLGTKFSFAADQPHLQRLPLGL